MDLFFSYQLLDIDSALLSLLQLRHCLRLLHWIGFHRLVRLHLQLLQFGEERVLLLLLLRMSLRVMRRRSANL